MKVPVPCSRSRFAASYVHVHVRVRPSTDPHYGNSNLIIRLLCFNELSWQDVAQSWRLFSSIWRKILARAFISYANNCFARFPVKLPVS